MPRGIACVLALIISCLLTGPLLSASDKTDIGLKVVAFCRAHKGQKVGTGQCGSLASNALKEVGGAPRGKDFPEKDDFVWGKLIVYVEGGDPAPKVTTGAIRDLRSGDIIQFRDTQFVHHKAKGTTTSHYAHHTAVIASLEGTTIHVLQQNVNEVQLVQDGTLQISELKAGWMRIYRPVPATGQPTTEPAD